MQSSRARTRLLAIGAVAMTAVMTGCSNSAPASTGAGGATSINVLMVNNPAQEELVKLTEKNFTATTGIKVNFTVLPENDLRAKATQEFTSQAGQYDVASLSNYEIPFYAKNGWLAPLDGFIKKDPKFNVSDILPAMLKSMSGADGKVYGMPFEGQSSFLMYRKDVFEKKGLTVPSNPTWDQVAALAAQVDGAEPGMKGICLRGAPGWGQVFAPLTTVVNTFGGTWFDKNWNAGFSAPEFKNAVDFYVNLVQEHGEPGAAQAGYTECLNNFMQGKTAMWVDATNSGGPLEAKDSAVAGKVGYAQSPVKLTKASGWLWTWAWGVQAASKKTDAAWKFVSWASSQQYEELVAKTLGWASVPYGKRQSTFDNPAFQSGAPFYSAALEAIKNADPMNPGVQPRPAPGIQFVGIPEFAALATTISEDISSTIAGKESVAEALNKGQQLAQKVGDTYKK